MNYCEQVEAGGACSQFHSLMVLKSWAILTTGHVNIQPAGIGDGTTSSISMTKAIKILWKILLPGIVEKLQMF